MIFLFVYLFVGLGFFFCSEQQWLNSFATHSFRVDKICQLYFEI